MLVVDDTVFLTSLAKKISEVRKKDEYSGWPMQDIMTSFTAPDGLTEAFLYLHCSPIFLHPSASLPLQMLILKAFSNELLAQKSPSQYLLLGHLTYKKSKLLSNYRNGKQVKLE